MVVIGTAVTWRHHYTATIDIDAITSRASDPQFVRNYGSKNLVIRLFHFPPCFPSFPDIRTN